MGPNEYAYYERESSLRDILNVLFRHKWKISIFFVIVVTVSVGITYLSAEIYESHAGLLIRVGRENLSMDPTVVGPTVGLFQNRDNEVNSELEILRSRLLVERVVDSIGPEVLLRRPDVEPSDKPAQEELRKVRRILNSAEESAKDVLVALDLDTELSTRDQAVKKVIGNLEVDVEKNSNIISLRFEAQDPAVARRALEVLIAAFLEHHIDVHRSQASLDFFEDQSEVLLQELQEKEDRLEAFRVKNRISWMERQKEGLVEQVYGSKYIRSSLQHDLDDIHSKIAFSAAKVAALEASLNAMSDTIELNRVTGKTNWAADAIKKQLLDLQLREADLAVRYPDDSRLLHDVRKQIAIISDQMGSEAETLTEVTTGIDSTFKSLQLNLATEQGHFHALVAQEQALEEAIEAKIAELDDLTRHETELKRLMMAVEIAEAEYRQYRDNFQRARISEALDLDKVSNVSIVQPATMPIEPIKPRKRRNVALAIFFGLAGGIGVAFLWEYFDDSLKTNEDVARQVELPVLVSISHREFRKCG